MTWRRVMIGLAVVVLAVGGFVEVITIHPKTGVAYISATDRRAIFAGKPVPGAIFAYDL